MFDGRPGEGCLEAQREYRCHVRRRAISAGGCQRAARRLSVYSVSTCDDRGVAINGRIGHVVYVAYRWNSSVYARRRLL